MKKILTSLASMTLTSCSLIYTISCDSNEKDNQNQSKPETPTNPDPETPTNPDPETPTNPDPETPTWNNKNLLIGYWYDWGGTYQEKVKLSDINLSYDVVNLSFLYTSKSYEMPSFSPVNPTEVKEGVKKLHQNNKKVLISMGGQTGEAMRFREDQKDNLKNTILNVIKEYELDGLDIDWEGSCLADRISQNVTSQALIEIKEQWKKENKEFFITMAPELPYLKTSTENSGGSYIPFFKKLDGYYNWINPQFYNGWAFGPYVEQEEASELGLGYGSVITNDDKEKRAEFYYLMTKYLTIKHSNLNGFYLIDPNKFVLGASTNEPAGRGAANEIAIKRTYELLKKNNIKIRGLMTWALNYDAYEGEIDSTLNGKEYFKKWSFANWYLQTFANQNIK
ncbi:chitinase [Spiroplasma litorale]|uniref:chitinase n=1 Tax=Spiroplasma litorale TaxID=216942 RepID=A0A0K1W1P2_9MOLU|nr:glycosyl hydrolase family 18 protein [Spiroplasma litorale]AKX34101.1 chitinase [Spiroplasma litorale]